MDQKRDRMRVPDVASFNLLEVLKHDSDVYVPRAHRHQESSAVTAWHDS